LVWFGLVYFLVDLVTFVTKDTSITVYNLYIATQLKMYYKANWKWNLSLHLSSALFSDSSPHWRTCT